ncbi:hypothetical protein I4U23_007641 [Adineta vaga]|nr:hypothetical protein I4U23_007641 [Adineta vaga]
MSQTRYDDENQALKQIKNQRSSTIHVVNQHRSLENYRQRSTTLSHSVDQMKEYMQRKFSRINDGEKQEFDDLKKIK